MQLAVLSDIHGNLPALEAVLDDLQQYSVDGIIVAGDIVGGGPQAVETAQCLRSLGSLMIRGNADNALLKYAAGESPANSAPCQQFALLRWMYHQLDQQTLDFIKSLPEQRVVARAGAAAIRVVHGSPRHPSEAIFPDRDPTVLDTAFAQISEPVLVCGHTHIPWDVEQNGRLALNPGAVSGPLNGVVGAQYALLTWREDHWQARRFTLSYDLERIRKACRESGFLDEGGAFARAILLCIETGKDVVEDFFSYVFGLAATAGFPDSDIIPDNVWEQAAATFAWAGYS